MRVKSRCLPLCILVGPFASAFCQAPSQTPQQLVELSRKASDITEIGSYRLQANVIIRGLTKNVPGQLTILRDKDRSRSEFQLASYRETRWIEDNMLYISRSQQVPLPKTPLLSKLDRLWRASLIPPDAKTSAVSKRNEHGKDVDCFEIKEKNSKRRTCFDSSTSVLVSDDSGLEFQDFSAVDGKYFPTRIVFKERFVSSEQVRVEVRDVTITKASFTGDVFKPPDGIPGLATCDNPTAPRMDKWVEPDIPRDELRRMGRGVVDLYGIIGADGNIRDLSVEYASDSRLAESVVKARRQSRYSPAMCGEQAVPAEEEERIIFSTQ